MSEIEFTTKPNCDGAPTWAKKNNILANVEAIRLHAYKQLTDLGFSPDEIQLDVSIFAADNTLCHLAKSLDWVTVQHWYEPPCRTEGGEITICYEPAEVIW